MQQVALDRSYIVCALRDRVRREETRRAQVRERVWTGCFLGRARVGHAMRECEGGTPYHEWAEHNRQAEQLGLEQDDEAQPSQCVALPVQGVMSLSKRPHACRLGSVSWSAVGGARRALARSAGELKGCMQRVSCRRRCCFALRRRGRR